MTMNRMVLVLVAASTAAAPAAAQQRSQLEAASARLAPAAAPLQAAAPRTAARAGNAGKTALQTLGGALIGAGAGYLASQVAWSDWDKHSNSEFAGRRLSFTLGGGAVGALAGLVLGHGGESGVGRSPTTPYNPSRPTHSMAAALTEDDLRASTALNLYQLLQAERPNWLTGRGVGNVRAGRPFHGPPGTTSAEPEEAPTASALPAQGEGDQATASEAPRVYLNGALIGDINTLRDMLVAETSRVEYLDTAQATYRFGAGNASGVILVTSLGRGGDTR
jgi:hypothetical protein